MRRIARNWNVLAQQLVSAGRGISGEPAWPASAPSQATVEAAGTLLYDLTTQMVAAENVLQRLRVSMDRAMADGAQLMRRVDQVTTALYGDADPQKHAFGLRPIDHIRNSAGPTPQVARLALNDGPTPQFASCEVEEHPSRHLRGAVVLR